MDRKTSDAHASIAGLSEATATTPAPSVVHPFETADDQRYRELSVVGAGGLGTVLRAHDQRLDREVALKRIGPGVDEREAAARFAREARITARLDHPGIVPIHDAGRTSDGRLFYTMRLIRGRSLAELASEATTTAARLALVPALAAACHAVGFAHRRRVVHRDLKPANLMVGELGETQVVDWGLADDLDASERAPGDQSGTPAYLSPEAVRGQGGTIAADVWALGAVLYELVTGQRRVEGTRDEVLATLHRGELAAERWPDEVPAELRAIAHKALALVPDDRYSDAEAMALDLEAFRDGRRVAAHAYTMQELTRRLLVAWRWPLAVVGAIAIATITVLGFTTYRTEQQRVRAVTAEAQTARELARAEASLGWALSASAVAALEADHAGRAELLAAFALAHGPNPDARGVLAATLAGAHPTSASRIEIAGCTNVVPAGTDLALCVAADRIELWELPARRLRWRRAAAFAGALRAGDTEIVGWTTSGEIAELDLATGAERARHRQLAGVTRVARDPLAQRVALHDRHTVVIIEPGTAPIAQTPCGDIHRIDAIALGHRDLWASCTGGELVLVSPGAPPQVTRRTPFGASLLPATSISLSEPETDLAIGGAGGEVLLVDLRGCMSPACKGLPDHELFATGARAIRSIHCLGNAAIALADSGDAIYVQRGVSAPVMALPIIDAGVAELGEAELRVGGAQLRRWSLPHDLPPRRLVGFSGLTRAAVSPDGAWIAVAAEGTVRLWSLETGQQHTVFSLGGTIGNLEFDPDSRYLAVSNTVPGGPGVHVYKMYPWTEVEIEGGPTGATYAGFSPDGSLLALDERTLVVWTGVAAPRVIESPRATAVAVGDPATRWLVDSSLNVWRVHGGQLALAYVGVGAVAIAASRDGRRVATAGPSRAEVRDLATGTVRTVEVRDAEILALALSPDARWLAAATTTGRIEVWDATSGALVAHLRGHRQRATWVAFRGGSLWSVGWDGAALGWDLTALDRDPHELAVTGQAAWGLTLDDVLATQP